MRILILHSRYRSGSASGENRVVEDEARLLSDAGHHVESFTPGIGQPSGREMVSAAVGTIWSRTAATEVKRRIEEGKPDIVHCHNLFPALSPAVIRATEGNVPVVLTLHNYRFLCLPGTFFRDGRICEDCRDRLPWPGVVHRCYQGSFAASAVLASSLSLHEAIGTYRQIRLYIAISDFVLQKHVGAGLPAHRIVVKRHFAWPVEPAREGPGEYFVYVGRLGPEKGVGTLLAAWANIRAKLLVVGDGPEAPRLRAAASPNVDFRGTLDPDEVATVMRRARALLIPSEGHEGAGKVALEAYAAGVPVLASNAGALPEVVQHEVTGLVLPPTDANAWSAGVERLLDDSESERMGASGRELWARHFSPTQGLANIESAYRRALG